MVMQTCYFKLFVEDHLQFAFITKTAPDVFVGCLEVKLIEGFNTFGVTDNEKLCSLRVLTSLQLCFLHACPGSVS